MLSTIVTILVIYAIIGALVSLWLKDDNDTPIDLVFIAALWPKIAYGMFKSMQAEKNKK